VLEKILQVLSITCSHKNTSQPFTAAVANPYRAAAVGDWESVGTGPSHYVVCLDCGKKFSYDWQQMKIVRN